MFYELLKASEQEAGRHSAERSEAEVDTSEGTKKTTRLRSKFFDSEGEALSYEKIVLANEGSLANEVSKSTE